MRIWKTRPRSKAIELIAEQNNLIFEEVANQKNVYSIKTQDEKAKEPTIAQHYTFSYAQADKILPLLASQLGGGTPQIDSRTNTVFYQVAKSNVDNIKLFLSTVDEPTRQVMIEARLVEVTAAPAQSYGINWAGVVGSARPRLQVFTLWRHGGMALLTSSSASVSGIGRLRLVLHDVQREHHHAYRAVCLG